jgi:hypothetical protein
MWGGVEERREERNTRSNPINCAALRHGLIGALYSREAKICNLNIPTVIDQKIVTFEIPKNKIG